MIFFLNLIYGFADAIIYKIVTTQKKLHNLTTFKTIYDVFDVLENVFEQNLTNAFFKVWKQNSLRDGTKLQGEIRVMLNELFNIVKDNREAYDYVLNHPYLMVRDDGYILGKVFIGLIMIILIFDLLRIIYKMVKRKGGIKDLLVVRIVGMGVNKIKAVYTKKIKTK